VGSEEGGVRRRFQERRGRRGGCVRSASSRGRRKPCGAHAVVRGEGGGGLVQSEAKAHWGGRPAAGPGRRRQPQRGGGGVGLDGGRGQAQGGEMGSGLAEGQGPGGWVKNRRWAQAQKEILFKFQLILEISRTLENCTRRFRKKFDMWIFPKIF
jgi:hypothetical protein